MKENVLYTMKSVAARTGLTPHVIRIWEKRYGAIVPVRSATNRRRYSEEDLERLTLLGKATRAGNSIGTIARLSNEQLAKLAGGREAGGSIMVQQEGMPLKLENAVLVQEALSAIQAMDSSSLEKILARFSVTLGLPDFLGRLIVPLMIRLGDLWHEGKLRAAQEHMALGVVRTVLGDLLRAADSPESAPAIVVATPAQQLHEIGALLAAVTAAHEGWRAIYLGPDLPAEEIAGAVELTHARAVALSILFQGDDATALSEIKRLRSLMPARVPLLVGGRAATMFGEALEKTDAILVADLASLRLRLQEIAALDSDT
jgi:DNA-binding transcriptional MerR regulator/methylmalonyl-CoA mutase cobalamin-binding subunit